MRIDDFSTVQDLMKTRDALQSSLADVDDKLRQLGVVVPKSLTEFDHSLALFKAHGMMGPAETSGDALRHARIDDGIFADYDAGVPTDTAELLGEHWGFALREGKTPGTGEIVLRGSGKQQGILALSRHMVLKWAAKLSDYAARG